MARVVLLIVRRRRFPFAGADATPAAAARDEPQHVVGEESRGAEHQREDEEHRLDGQRHVMVIHVLAVDVERDELVEGEDVYPRDERHVLAREDARDALRAPEVAHEAGAEFGEHRRDADEVEHGEVDGEDGGARDEAGDAPLGQEDQQQPRDDGVTGEVEERHVHGEPPPRGGADTAARFRSGEGSISRSRFFKRRAPP